MAELNDRKWADFYISEIFNLESGNSIVNSTKLNSGYYPLISARKFNNGVDNFIETKKINEKKAITWNKQGDGGGGLAFFQRTSFANKSTVFILRPKTTLTKNQMIFISCLLSRYHEVFNHGYGLNEDRFKVSKIILPINKHEKPDWEFMEEYIKNKEKKLLEEYKNYIKNIIENYETIDIGNLESKEWKSFSIFNIFEECRRGKRLIKSDHILGSIPYVSSSAELNGIDGFIGNEGNVRKYKNCLTLANSGSVGCCFYQPFEFIASDHVTKLENDSFNKYVYLFISTILSRLSEKYSFNREISNKRLKTEKIILPLDDSGNPDYNFMENYMKKIEYEKIMEFLDFKQKEYPPIHLNLYYTLYLNFNSL